MMPIFRTYSKEEEEGINSGRETDHNLIEEAKDMELVLMKQLSRAPPNSIALAASVGDYRHHAKGPEWAGTPPHPSP
jgi:hypothetical protein